MLSGFMNQRFMTAGKFFASVVFAIPLIYMFTTSHVAAQQGGAGGRGGGGAFGMPQPDPMSGTWKMAPLLANPVPSTPPERRISSGGAVSRAISS